MPLKETTILVLAMVTAPAFVAEKLLRGLSWPEVYLPSVMKSLSAFAPRGLFVVGRVASIVPDVFATVGLCTALFGLLAHRLLVGAHPENTAIHALRPFGLHLVLLYVGFYGVLELLLFSFSWVLRRRLWVGPYGLLRWRRQAKQAQAGKAYGRKRRGQTVSAPGSPGPRKSNGHLGRAGSGLRAAAGAEKGAVGAQMCPSLRPPRSASPAAPSGSGR